MGSTAPDLPYSQHITNNVVSIAHPVYRRFCCSCSRKLSLSTRARKVSSPKALACWPLSPSIQQPSLSVTTGTSRSFPTLCGHARVAAPLCVLHTATQATFLRRRGHGAPSPRLMGAGDNLLGASSCCAPPPGSKSMLVPSRTFALRVAAACPAVCTAHRRGSRRPAAQLRVRFTRASRAPFVTHAQASRALALPTCRAGRPTAWHDARGRLWRRRRLRGGGGRASCHAAASRAAGDASVAPLWMCVRAQSAYVPYRKNLVYRTLLSVVTVLYCRQIASHRDQ